MKGVNWRLEIVVGLLLAAVLMRGCAHDRLVDRVEKLERRVLGVERGEPVG